MKTRTASIFLFPAVVLSSFFLACSLFANESRTWTSSGGKSIQATLIHFDGKTAELKRADGKVVRIALDKFSEKDREFLARLDDAAKETEDENPFAGGETIVRSSDGFLPLDTRETLVPLTTIPAWKYTPDPAAQVVSETPAAPLSFEYAASSNRNAHFNLDWSDLHFHPVDPSKVLLSVFVHPAMMSSAKPYTRLFIGDLKKGTVVFTDMPRNFRLSGVSPDGKKLLFLEGPLRNIHSFGTQTKVHIFQFTDDLQLTRLIGFEPFLDLPVIEQSLAEPETPPSKPARKTSSKKTPPKKTITDRNGVTLTVTTHAERMKRKDPLGRDPSGMPSRRDVSWGTWLDADKILLLAGGGCLISLDTKTGKVAWSIPDGSFGAAIVSPGKRYCIFRANSTIQGFLDEKSRSSLRRQTPGGGISYDNPYLLFDMKNGELCGRLEGDSQADKPCFSPDGKTLAASWKGAILRWDMADGKRREPIYYSPPFFEGIRAGIPNRQVQNNQEPGIPRWMNNRYLLQGTLLIDTLTESPVWKYVAPSCKNKGYHGGICWFAMESPGNDHVMKLFACRLPHAQVSKQAQTGPDSKPFVFEPGMNIALRIDGSIVSERDRITKGLEQTIAQNGWVLKPDAPVVMTARIVNEPARDAYYVNGRLVLDTEYERMKEMAMRVNVDRDAVLGAQKASYVSPRLELDIKDGEKVLWSIFALPDQQLVTQNAVKQGSLQGAVDDALRQVDCSKWFTSVNVPAKIRENVELNTSTITIDTYRDY